MSDIFPKYMIEIKIRKNKISYIIKNVNKVTLAML